jgi:hypothetical protein
MTDTYFYTLNECEAACVSWYGKHINEFAAKSGLTECKVATDRDGLQIQVEGIGAEWAFAKAHNIFPNTNMSGPNHIDFTMPSGVTVDVKSTDRQNGNLLVPLRFNISNSADAFALVRGTMAGGFNYVGHVMAVEFFQKAEKRRMRDDLPATWFFPASGLNRELMK